MPLSISKALSIEREERGIVFLLLTQSVFLGIFAGALDVGANALFLDVYSADQMPRAFMFSGAVGIVFTSVYTYLQKRLPFKLFTVLNLLVAILLTAALRIGYGLSDDPGLTFALLVLMGPLIIISMLGFWGTAGRYFSLREGKRLFGIIDTGSIVGMILAFYAVPVLVRFDFNVYDTLLIGLVSLLFALVFQLVVLRRFAFTARQTISRERSRRTGFFSLFRKRYTSLMAFFVVLSVICAFFIHYSFMWATEANYDNNRELTSFLGAFFGTMMIFTVIIKSTLYGWLMKNYGLRITLLISPALLLILTVVASLVGGVFGYAAEAAGFTLFFLIIALSKLFNKSLKDAIESPSMKILYQSLDSGERFDVQARIDGVVNEVTAFTSGLLMAGLLLLSFVNVIHFSYILIALLIVWVILGYLLYKSYRNTLNDTLASARATIIEEEQSELTTAPSLPGSPMFVEIIRLDPYFYHFVTDKTLEDILRIPSPGMQKSAWKFISGTLYPCKKEMADEVYNATTDQELREIIERYRMRLKRTGKTPEKAFATGDRAMILSALLQIVEDRDTSRVPHIIALLRDRDYVLRSAAIEAAGRLGVKELGTYLVDYLGHPLLYAVTWSSLVQIGEVILENLENAFHKTGTDTMVQLRIIRAMIAIGGSKANQYLFSKIDFHQREIREAAIQGLYINDFMPGEKERLVLHSVIYDVTVAGANNIAAEYVTREKDPGSSLHKAILEEQARTGHLLFTLLSITYDRNAVEHVQKSIEDTENEGAGFALELLNLIVEDELFAYLEPYFDDLSVPEKVRRLQNEMPVEIPSYESLLIDLLNRDGLYTGGYLRLCTIEAIRLDEGSDAGRYLAAQVFNPDRVISSSAAEVLFLKDKTLYEEVNGRIRIYHGDVTPDDQAKESICGNEMIGIVESLHTWETFGSLDRDLLLKLVNVLRPVGENDPHDPALVSLIRNPDAGSRKLREGIVINITDHPSVLEQIDYLASEPGFILLQAEREEFRRLLFDIPELLEACTRLFNDQETATFINTKVTR